MWARSPNKTYDKFSGRLPPRPPCYTWHWVGKENRQKRSVGLCHIRAFVSGVRAMSVPADDKVCMNCERKFGTPARDT